MAIGTHDVPVVILCGGRGARFDHESQVLPKPLIQVAGKPMLGHIMDLFEAQGFKKFYIAGGFKCELVAEYLQSRYECNHQGHSDFWVYGNKGEQVSSYLIDTGLEATTGDRLMRFEREMFLGTTHFITYGDGLCDVNLKDLYEHHMRHTAHGKQATSWEVPDPTITITAVHPPGRFGTLEIENAGLVTAFDEKPSTGWINGGFMVADAGAVLMNAGEAKFDNCQSFESGALHRMASKGRLRAYRHEGYWACMDTRRDLETIERDVNLANGILPWRKDLMK